MPLESAKYRLTKWNPEKVIIGTHDDAAMTLPEDWAPQQFHIRLIACRNLCKRILQKHCTIANGSSK
jgi:hypothetical protein